LVIAWQQAFDVSFAELGLAMAVMSAAAAVMQTPMGFLVDRYGARPFLIGGTLLMTLSMAAMDSPPPIGRSSSWHCSPVSATRSSTRRITPF
jgi:MFS family permease